jgi:hypothetical protein
MEGFPLNHSPPGAADNGFIFFEQHGDISMPVNIAHNVSGKSTIPLNTSTICHERIANYVVNFFTE